MATRAKPQPSTVENELETMDVAPLPFQAEVLRGQICDDINRRFWRARQRLVRAFDDRKEQVERDFDKLSADQFLAKYNGHRFL